MVVVVDVEEEVDDATAPSAAADDESPFSFFAKRSRSALIRAANNFSQ